MTGRPPPGRRAAAPHEYAGLPELRELRYFLVVAEELHFGEAARRLFMSQPPLSQAIAKLERALGAALFRRTSRSVELTEAGEVLKREARAVLDAARLAVERTRAVEQGEAGSLLVGITVGARFSAAASIVEELHRRHPGLQIETAYGTAAALLGALEQGQVDAVFAYEVRPRDWEVLEPVHREPIVAVVGERNPYAGRAAATLAQLLAQPLAIGVDAAMPRADGGVLEVFERRQLTPQLEIQASDPDWRGALVSWGFAIEPAAAPRHPATWTLALSDVSDEFVLVLARRREPARPALERLLEVVRELGLASADAA